MPALQIDSYDPGESEPIIREAMPGSFWGRASSGNLDGMPSTAVHCATIPS